MGANGKIHLSPATADCHDRAKPAKINGFGDGHRTVAQTTQWSRAAGDEDWNGKQKNRLPGGSPEPD
jgi:hypothetical protein